MEVRALVAIVQNPQQIVQQHIKNHYNMISQSPTQVNFQKRPFSPLTCTAGCGCFDNFQRAATANQDRMRPTMQPILQQPSCCGSQNCLCRRNNLLMLDKVNRGTDMSMLMLDSERIAQDQNRVHHFHHIDLTASANKEQMFIREQAGTHSVSSINEELLPPKNTEKQPPLYVYQQQPQPILQTSVNETDGERQLTNPLNQFEDYVKKTQSAVGQMYINSKMNFFLPTSSLTQETQQNGQLINQNRPFQNNPPMSSQNNRRQAGLNQPKHEHELMIGGKHMNHKRVATAEAGYHHQGGSQHQTMVVGNPQIQIVKTICSTKNSFLPNFKMKKREYQFGEHKLNNIQNAQLFNQNQLVETKSLSNGRVVLRNGTPYSEKEGGKIFSPLTGTIGSNSPNGRRGSTNQQQQAEDVKQTELKYLHKLEKLVSHKPKLSNLIKETITRTNRNQIARTLQVPNPDVNNQNSQFVTDGMIFQQISPDIYFQQIGQIPYLPQSAQVQMRSRLNPTPLTNLDTFSNQVDDYIAPLMSEYNRQNPEQPPQKSTTPTQNRAVIVINQSDTQDQQPQQILPFQAQHHSRSQSKAAVLTSNNNRLAEDGATSGGIGPSYYNNVNGEEIRIGTEEDTNYLKFIINEMKPNYHIEGADFKHLIMQTNETANSPGILDYKIPAFIESTLPVGGINTLEGEIIQPQASDSSPVNRSVRKGVMVNNNDYLIGPSLQLPLQNDKIVMFDGMPEEIDLNEDIYHGSSLQNQYFRDSLQQPRSKSQGMKYRANGALQLKKEISPRGKIRNASGRSSRSKQKRKSQQSSLKSSYGIPPAAQADAAELRSIKIKQSTLQSRRLGSSISHLQGVDHLGEETVQENQTASLKNRRVMSENQSIASSSQYKTIKFKLMIMKSPQASKQEGLTKSPSNNERNEINNRNVGGRESSKNFRKDLKRHNMLEGVTGASPSFFNQRTHKSSMQVDQMAMKSKRTAASILGTTHQRRTLKGKSFIGVKGDKINIPQNIQNLGSTINQQYSEIPQPTNLSVSNNNLHHADSQKPQLMKPSIVQGPGEKMSQDTFLNSSAVPLPPNMNSIYQGRQFAQSTKSNHSPDKLGRESVLEKSRYNNKQEEDEKIDERVGEVGQRIDHANQLHIINTDDEYEDQDLITPANMQSRPPQQQPGNAGGVMSEAQNLDAFSFKSGGEIGGGLFSNVTNQGDDTESEYKNLISSNLRKSAYQLLPRSNQSKREASSRRTNRKSHQLNQDLHSMIIKGGSKTRHTRDQQKTPTAQTVQKGGLRMIGSDDRETLNQPTVIPKVDNIKEGEDKLNDTLSFESSVQSNKSVKGEEEVSPGDKTTKSNDGMHFEDLYLRNANYIMRYLDAPQPHQIDEASFGGRANSAINQVDQNNMHPEDALLQTDINSMIKATPLSGFLSPQPTTVQRMNQYKTSKQRIAEVQLMNQKLKVRPSELGQQVLQGRPIKPLRQLIKENFQQFAIHNLKVLEDKKVKRMTQLQQFFIDLQGSPKNSTHVIKKSPNIVEEDEDMRLTKYIWGTINQLKQEGYPIDTNMFRQHFLISQSPLLEEDLNSQNPQTGLKAAASAFGSKAFSNKRIKNAQKTQFVTGISSLENSDKGGYGSIEPSERTTMLLERHRGKRASHLDYPNADLLQIKFKDQERRDDDQMSSVTLVVRNNTGDLSMMGKTEEESTMNKGEDKNETMTSNQLSQRGEHSFISPAAVNAIYAQEYPIDMLSTHHDQTQEKPEIDKTLFKLPHQQLRIPVSNYYHTQRLENEKNNDKKLPFDLHLLKMNSPHLPQQLSPRLIQNRSKPRLASEIQTSSNPQHSSRKFLNSMGSQITTGRVLSQQQQQQPPPSPNFKPNVRLRNDSNLRNSQLSRDGGNGNLLERNSKILKSDRGVVVRESQGNESMGKPSRESKIPKGIGEIVIKTIDRMRTSLGTTLGHPTPKEDIPLSTSIFLIKSPGFQNEIKEQTNMMQLRNKTQKLKTTPGGILTPQNLQKQYAAELNEFSGAEIVIKDLHTLRNKDMLRLPAANDYSWTPKLSLPSSKDQRLLYSRASNQDKPKLTSGGHRRFISSDINNQPKSTMPTPSSNSQVQSKPVSTPQSLQSHTPHQHPQQHGMFTKIGFIGGSNGGRKTSNDYGTLNSMRRNMTERCGSQFQKVRKGRALEDNISGTKVSNGIRIIT